MITPNPERLGYIRFALEQGWTVEQIHEITSIDPWFLKQLREMSDLERDLSGQSLAALSRQQLLHAKRDGLSDPRLGRLLGSDANTVRARRKELGDHGGVQSRGYLRGRIRKLHAVPVFELRIGKRIASPAIARKS